MIPQMVEDPRTILAIEWDDPVGSTHRVGRTCDMIQAYREDSLVGTMPFLAVWKGGQIVKRVPAYQVSLTYFEEEPEPSEEEALKTAALKACLEYEEQASRIKELTEAIGAEVCPQQSESDLCHGGMVPGSPSCFGAAALEHVAGPMAYPYEGPEYRRLTLDEIEERVKDCPSCTKLVAMIRERKEAKKRWGVAKRRVRSVGKRVKEADNDS